jgi:hypothetical protein
MLSHETGSNIEHFKNIKLVAHMRQKTLSLSETDGSG